MYKNQKTHPQHADWSCISTAWRCDAAAIPASVGGFPATNRSAFSSRFAVNDPLRTCDMRQTLIALLHHSFEVFASGGPVLDGRDYGSWVPIRVGPWG